MFFLVSFLSEHFLFSLFYWVLYSNKKLEKYVFSFQLFFSCFGPSPWWWDLFPIPPVELGFRFFWRFYFEPAAVAAPDWKRSLSYTNSYSCPDDGLNIRTLVFSSHGFQFVSLFQKRIFVTQNSWRTSYARWRDIAKEKKSHHMPIPITANSLGNAFGGQEWISFAEGS